MATPIAIASPNYPRQRCDLMIVMLCQAADDADIQNRLGRLGVRVERFSGAVVPPLTADSAATVYAVPFSVLSAPPWAGLRVRLAHSSRLFLVIGNRLSSADFMTAARDGAFDVVLLGDEDTRWAAAFQRIVESQRLWVQLYGGAPLASGEVLIGQSAAMQTLRQAIERVGPTDVSVLIVGESGVGKEKVAAALHQAARRKPFLPVNCAAIPKELIEAELFGAEKGAFTGAVRSRPGLVEQADGGTLFLDEIGELELALQPKLLRFLETRSARRVGGEQDYRVRVRLISATNRALEQAVADGTFRSDLYYRLAEILLPVPPLRERREDIPLFVREFLQRANERFGKLFESVEPALIRRFQDYDWPGNVRELKSAVDRLVLLYDGPMLREGFWEPPPNPTRAVSGRERTGSVGNPPSSSGPLPEPAFAGPSRRVELARQLLAEGRLRLTEIAAHTGVHPTTLFRWRKAGKV